MYCHTSSSVQFEIGNTRMFSPGCTRVLYRSQSSGRCAFGSHWPNSSRKEKMRSLARAFSSSRRAPPMQASKPCSAIVSSSVTACAALRESVAGLRRRTVPLLDRVFDRADDQALAQFGHARVAEGDHFVEVVAGVDVHQREREFTGPEGLFGQAQQHHRVLAAREQQGRVGAFGRHFAHDVDRFGFERVEVARVDVGQHARRCR